MALADAGASSISVTGMLYSRLKDKEANGHQFVFDRSQFEKRRRCRISCHNQNQNTYKEQNKVR
jgi:hypothetical protein